jgi:hypothetical protein
MTNIASAYEPRSDDDFDRWATPSISSRRTAIREGPGRHLPGRRTIAATLRIAQDATRQTSLAEQAPAAAGLHITGADAQSSLSTFGASASSRTRRVNQGALA